MEPASLLHTYTLPVLMSNVARGWVEAACHVALQIGAFRYSTVRDILKNNRDRTSTTAAADWTSPAHENVRGPGYYQ